MYFQLVCLFWGGLISQLFSPQGRKTWSWAVWKLGFQPPCRPGFVPPLTCHPLSPAWLAVPWPWQQSLHEDTKILPFPNPCLLPSTRYITCWALCKMKTWGPLLQLWRLSRWQLEYMTQVQGPVGFPGLTPPRLFHFSYQDSGDL